MSNAVVEFRKFSFKYEGTKDYSLKNINLKIEKGELLLIAGKSGAGKTTLARAITGLIPHFYKGVYEGEVYVDGFLTKDTPMYKLAEVVGLVRQNPENQILMSSVERDIAFSLEFMGMSREEMVKRVNKIIADLGIQEIRDRHVDSLSGGELQKVALAAILVKNPSIIILDEPSAYLSPSSVKILKKLVLELNQRELTIVIIDHKLEYWMDISERIVVLKTGNIVFDGKIKDFLPYLTKDTFGLNIPLYMRLILDLRKNCEYLDLQPSIEIEDAASTLRRLIT